MVESLTGDNFEGECLGCSLRDGETETVGGRIVETGGFEVRQDFEIPIIGFIIIASKKHVTCIEDFTEVERKELVDLVFQTRKAMREVIGVKTVYVVQEEDSPHFHLWLFPRHGWMKLFGEGIGSVKPAMEHARKNMKTEEQTEKIRDAVEKLKRELD